MSFLFSLPWGALCTLLAIELGPTRRIILIALTLSSILGCLTLLVLGNAAASLLTKLFRGNSPLPPGLLKTLEYALQGHVELKTPELSLFPSPVPEILVTQSLSGEGRILLSQGAISLFTEAELRSILLLATRKTEEPGLALRTIASLCAWQTLRIMPERWTRLLLEIPKWGRELKELNALSAIYLLILYPTLRFFMQCSSPIPGRSVSPHEGKNEYRNALEKLTWNKELNRSIQKYSTQTLQLT